jgi:glycosyltransferase involved in cell wall biosynthesis
MPLAAAPGLDSAVAAGLAAGERRALMSAAAVVVTGASTRRTLSDYGIEAERIVVIEPGTDRAPQARGSGAAGPVQLLSVGTITAGKGHDLLIRSLAALPHRNWHLTCAGSLERDSAAVERVYAAVRDERVEPQLSFAGDLDAARLDACYDGADVFVLATLHETYCMAVAEALARGLPVISTRTGAIPELVGDDAGIVVPPADGEALTAALRRVLDDRQVRERLAQGARRAGQRLPSWEDASGKMADALARIADGG